MEDHTGRILLFIALIVATSRSVHAIYSKEAAGRELQSYIVHMDPTKVQIPESMNPATWYASFIRDAVVKAGALNDEEFTESSIFYAYDTVLTGFAARLSGNQVAAIKAMESCMGAYPDEILKLHTTYSPRFLGLYRGQGLWSDSTGYASDVIVGVLDTGVWPEHPSFAEHKNQTAVPSKWKGHCDAGQAFSASNCNKKLIGARFFYKGFEASGGYINETVEYKSARDSVGHGTHTASTAAGNVVPGANVLGYAKGSASGMAPGARVAVYKICWAGGCSNSDILAAMEKAVVDGVDVLSLSIGGGSNMVPFYADNLAIGAFGAVAKGIFVSFSAGNSGPDAASLSNQAPWMMTVGASSVDRNFLAIVVLGNGRAYRGATLYSGKPLGRKPDLELVYGELCLEGSLKPKVVRGKIVVCELGNIEGVEKGQVVARAGGIGMIELSNEYLGESLIAESHVLPATFVGAKAGKAIRGYLQSNRSRPTGTIVFYGTVYHREEAPILCSFSSRGPNAVSPDILKPDIIAPGLNILAAWPENLSPSGLPSDKRRTKFNLESGTSMSCPHVSGLAALLRSVHRHWSPAAIKSALMTTAYITNTKGNPIRDAASLAGPPATPFDIGAGHVNPEKAREPGLVYDIGTQDYVNYLCSLNYSSSEIGVLTKTRVSCPKPIPKPGDLNYPSFSVVFYSSGSASATFTRKVTNVGPDNSTYSVEVAEPLGVKVTVNPRTLVFTKKNQSHIYTVTFGAEQASASGAFGSITWSSGLYKVRSPVAVLWVDRSINFQDNGGLVS